MRPSGHTDLVPLFLFPLLRVRQLEGAGQGSGQQKHSGCGPESAVLPSPEAGPQGTWQGQPSPCCCLNSGPLPAHPHSPEGILRFPVLGEAEQRDALDGRLVSQLSYLVGRDIHPALPPQSLYYVFKMPKSDELSSWQPRVTDDVVDRHPSLQIAANNGAFS